MEIFDAHCDTISKISEDIKLFDNDLNVSIKEMKGFKNYTVVFAIFLENEENAWEKFLKIRENLLQEIKRNEKHIELCLSYNDMLRAHSKSKCAAFLSLEGAYMVESEEDIYKLYSLGVRCICLTWNNENRLAGGVWSDKGLTSLGKKVVKRIEDIGIILDVSHLCDRSLKAVFEIAKKPIIASHSNSRVVCNNLRNLTDEQFVKIIKLGGCVGINLYSEFVSGKKESDSMELFRHIKHFIDLGGEDFIGIGTDFDGADFFVDDIEGISGIKGVINGLKEYGLNDEQIEKLTHKNFKNLLKRIL